MRLENEQLHYRAKFETFPFETQNPAMPKVLQVVWDWLRKKEARRREWPLFGALGAHGARDSFFEGTLDCGYPGGLNTEKVTKLRVDSFSDESDGGTLWAMEYDEPDGRLWFRHWHTQIGLRGTPSGSCVVNVRVVYYTLPDYVGRASLVPFANVPNFVREIVGLRAYQSCVGETVLDSEEVYLDGKNFDELFASNLLSPQRELPLILMCTDEDGKTPVWDATEFAEKLVGMANVYVADWRDAGVRELLGGLFRRGENSFQYRCGATMLRIYRPGVDLDDASGWRSHPFFSKSRIDGYCERDESAFIDIVSRGLGRSILREDSDVLGISDVEWARSRRDSRELALRLEEMRASSLLGRPREEGPDADEERIRALERELEDSRWYIDEFAKENDGLRRAASALKAENADLSNENSALRYRVRSAEDRADSLEEEASALRGAASAVQELERIPSALTELLSLAESVWPSRLVVLPEARRSAEEFKGNLEEEWQIIRAVATVLWPLYFEEDDAAGIEDAFRLGSGYELALTESGITKGNQKMMAERRRIYRGEEIDITPHVKGKIRYGSKQMFRLHYYADRGERKIVIGHCGDHLTTAGTRKL